MASPNNSMKLISILFLFFSFTQTHGQGDGCPTKEYVDIMSSDKLVHADIWDPRPYIMSANFAFEGIEGVENQTRAGVESAGGTWLTGLPRKCANHGFPYTTSAMPPEEVAKEFGCETHFLDGMPIVFSWPVKVTTVQPSDFRMHLNTGDVVTPKVASIVPNNEWNERSTVVVFGKFGNRIPPDEEGAVYVEIVEVVEDDSPLTLVGPNGTTVSAVNMTYDASCCIPYARNATGPTLVAAKLSHFSSEGEFTAKDDKFVLDPNSCSDLYGNEVQYRLRMYTTGGFSPNGVLGLKPTEYAKHFRVYASAGNDKSPVSLNETGVEYEIGEFGKIEILGLADLGRNLTQYDDCYLEDADNYIDICIRGDEEAARQIKWLEMPAGNATADPQSQYKPLYNPGGPGNNPVRGVRYTAPSPYLLLNITMALDNPMVVTVNNGTNVEPDDEQPDVNIKAYLTALIILFGAVFMSCVAQRLILRNLWKFM